MTTTSRLQITLVDTAMREKEVTISEGFTKIDTAIAAIQDTRMLADSAADPAGVYPAGTMYFNTTTSKLRVLRPNLTWSNAA